jgi:hypothetical protein
MRGGGGVKEHQERERGKKQREKADKLSLFSSKKGRYRHESILRISYI